MFLALMIDKKAKLSHIYCYGGKYKSISMENPFMMHLATVVRAHRKQSGLSQQELAKYAGVGKTVIFDIEHGKASIQINTLLKVLLVLNIKIQLKSPLIAEEVTNDA